MAAFTQSTPSLSTEMTPLLDFILQPIAVLTIVTLVSISYKRCKPLDISPETRQLFINCHALTTELCQLVLVALAPLNTAPIISDIILLAGGNYITAGKAALIIQVLVVGSLLFHSAAVVMVDMIEGYVLLEKEANTQKYQSFLITRNCLSSMWRNFTQRTTPRRPEIRTPGHIIRALENRRKKSAALHCQLAKLYHLDLAGPDNFRTWTSHAYRLSMIPAPTPMLTASGKAQRNAFKDLPTPPDSNELKETKRVKWTPTSTVFSPSGAERRGSVP